MLQGSTRAEAWTSPVPPFALFEFVASTRVTRFEPTMRRVAPVSSMWQSASALADHVNIGPVSISSWSGLTTLAVLCFAASFELKLESHRINGRHGRELALRRMSGAPDRIHACGDRSPSPPQLRHQKPQKISFYPSPPNNQVRGLIFCANTVSIERRIGGRR